MADVVVALRFGRFGREDNTLIMVTASGALDVKILKRTAKFVPLDVDGERLPSAARAPASGGKLIVPKKTKLFVDQTMREREQYLGKHKAIIFVFSFFKSCRILFLLLLQQ